MDGLTPQAILILAALSLGVWGINTTAHAVKHGTTKIVHVIKKAAHKLNPCDGSDCLF